ncbi:MAG TPA: hypothetical protein VNK04_05865, partial [Gemmataceae bacterium]|nr:hypothetical protein [Gemmataceae bacterium]
MPLTLLDRQALAADDAVGQADRLLAGPVLVHDGGEEAAEVVELQLAVLAGDDGHAGVAEQLPVRHHVEDVLARQARLLGDQHGRERAGLGRLLCLALHRRSPVRVCWIARRTPP